jgi:hypothetical protein
MTAEEKKAQREAAKAAKLAKKQQAAQKKTEAPEPDQKP